MFLFATNQLFRGRFHGNTPCCHLNLLFPLSHARLLSMQSFVLTWNRLLLKSLWPLRTRVTLGLTLLVLWSHGAMPLSAVAPSMHDDMKMLPMPDAAPAFQIQTGIAHDARMLCCIPGAELLCPLTGIVGQATAVTSRWTPDALPLPFSIASLWMRTSHLRIPTPPPRV